MSDQPDERASAVTTTSARVRLLEAAAEELIDVGPDEASLEAIARRAGEPLTTLENHFPSRLELMAELTWHLYVATFRSLPAREEGEPDLAAFLGAYVRSNRRPEVQLIWQLGHMLQEEHPDSLDAAYWHLVSELEKRITDHDLDPDAAHERALVLTPALMMVSRRTNQDLAGDEEIDRFVRAATRLVLSPDAPDVLDPGSGGPGGNGR